MKYKWGIKAPDVSVEYIFIFHFCTFWLTGCKHIFSADAEHNFKIFTLCFLVAAAEATALQKKCFVWAAECSMNWISGERRTWCLRISIALSLLNAHNGKPTANPEQMTIMSGFL